MILILIIFAYSQSHQTHYFKYNYGPIYYDYSENEQFSYKGESLEVDELDPIDTDRGSYFNGHSIITQTSSTHPVNVLGY